MTKSFAHIFPFTSLKEKLGITNRFSRLFELFNQLKVQKSFELLVSVQIFTIFTALKRILSTRTSPLCNKRKSLQPTSFHFITKIKQSPLPPLTHHFLLTSRRPFFQHSKETRLPINKSPIKRKSEHSKALRAPKNSPKSSINRSQLNTWTKTKNYYVKLSLENINDLNFCQCLSKYSRVPNKPKENVKKKKVWSLIRELFGAHQSIHFLISPKKKRQERIYEFKQSI